MVAIQPASPSGCRCASEIETSGMSAYTRNSGRSSSKSSRPCNVVTCATDGEVEFSRALQHPFDHQEVGREVIHNRALEAQRLPAYRNQRRRRARVAAGEEGNLMTKSHELVSQIRNDALCAAIKLWRHAFVKGRYLGNPHKWLDSDEVRRTSSDDFYTSSGATRAPAAACRSTAIWPSSA